MPACRNTGTSVCRHALRARNDNVRCQDIYCVCVRSGEALGGIQFSYQIGEAIEGPIRTGFD